MLSVKYNFPGLLFSGNCSRHFWKLQASFLVNEYLINYINNLMIFITTHIWTVQTLRHYSYLLLLTQVFFLNICSHDQAAHVQHRMMTSTVKCGSTSVTWPWFFLSVFQLFFFTLWHLHYGLYKNYNANIKGVAVV